MNDCTLPDGRKFAWRASGSGAPLILIHGWGSCAAIFAELMEHLPAYHCLSPDLPGYGDSAAAPHVDLDPLADDFLAWFDLLGLESVTLLGWSLGGILVQHLALRFPARVDRLILIASTPRFVTAADWPHGLADAAVRVLARDFKRAPALTLENFRRLQFQGEDSLPTAALAEVEPATALGGLELLRQVDLRAQLSAITQPTLVLHGSEDVIIPIGAGRYLAEKIPHALFHEVQGGGHAPFCSDVAQVSAALGHFLP